MNEESHTNVTDVNYCFSELTLFKIDSTCLSSVKQTLSSYFSYIVAASSISGGNRSTKRKTPTCRKLLQTLSHNAVSSTPRHERGSNSLV
jgi:hypothetical protein